MKTNPVVKIVLCVLIAAGCWNSAPAQDLEEEAVREMIETKNYVFKAQMALPMGGRSRYLTSPYDMKVSDDLITAYLPYFGRAYRAPADLKGGGIDFESRDFEYKVKDRKKGGWDVVIEPNDTEDVRQLSLTVSASGSASLRVNSDRRQSISFTGYITEKESGNR